MDTATNASAANALMRPIIRDLLPARGALADGGGAILGGEGAALAGAGGAMFAGVGGAVLAGLGHAPLAGAGGSMVGAADRRIMAVGGGTKLGARGAATPGD